MVKKATDIERVMKCILLNMNVSFKSEYKIGNYPVDFYLPDYNLSLQCDGCWVHNHMCKNNKYKKIYPRQIFQQQKDRSCAAYHIYHKINLIRFNGCEILDNTNKIIDKLKCIFKKIKNGELVHEYRKV